MLLREICGPPVLRLAAEDAWVAALAENNALGGLLLHQLLLRLYGEVVEFEADLRRRNGSAFSGEIIGHLVDDVFVAARFELGGYHFLGIGFGVGARQPHPFRRPHPQQPVAPSGGFESELLIMLEPGLEFLLTVSEAGHVLSHSNQHSEAPVASLILERLSGDASD